MVWRRNLALVAMLGLAVGCEDFVLSGPIVEGALIDGARAFWSDGSLLIELSGPLDDAYRQSQVRVEVERFDAADRSQGVLTGSLYNGYAEAGVPQRIFWPVDTRPDHVRVKVFEGNTPIFVLPLDAIVDVPLTRAACDPAGLESRCPRGEICLFDPHWPYSQWPGGGRVAPVDRELGQCQPLTVRAWHAWAGDAVDADGRAADVVVELMSQVPMRGTSVQLVAQDGRTAMSWAAMEGDRGRRALARMQLGGELGRVDVRIGPQVMATSLFVHTPEVAFLGNACDPMRVSIQCAPESMCVENRCVAATPPQVRSLVARSHGEALTIEFEAADREQDVVAIQLGVVNAQGGVFEVMRWTGGEDRIGQQWYPHEGELIYHGERVRGRLTIDRLWRGYEAVQVTAIDALGLTGAAQVVPVPSEPVPLDVGADCDPYGVDGICPDGHVCDRADGDRALRCHARRPVAGDCLGVPPLVDAIEGHWDEGDLMTLVTCGTYDQEPVGSERRSQVFAFTAPEEGSYLFVADGDVGALAVRTACDLPRSEHPDGFPCGNARYPAALVPLHAGETVYAVVQDGNDASVFSWRGERGAFSLSVERDR
ncbi:MAG: hypothetical protein KC620_02560 [Myxococcales bacterium]|nr:hypothetical protein [Myxococcales bacterium]